MKPIYKILIAVVILIVVGFVIYFVWSKFFVPTSLPSENTQPSETLGSPTETPSTTGTSTQGVTTQDTYTLKKLSDVTALGFWVSKTTNSVFYIATSGIVMEAKEGDDVVVSKQSISRFIGLEPSPSGDKALVSSGDPSSPQWSLFDSVDKVWRPLPSEILVAAWGGSDNQLVGVVKKDGKISLSFIAISKQPYEFKPILSNFAMIDVFLSAKSSTEILIYEKPSAFYSSRVWQLDTKTGILTLVLSPSSGSFIKWGQYKDVLFRFSSPNRFSIMDRSFGEITPTRIITLPTKCDGGVDVAYCFVPKDAGVFSKPHTMPDDYFMNKLYTNDDLYKIGLSTGNETLVTQGGSGAVPALDADNVEYVNSSIYFMNKYDGFVYVVEHKSNEIINDY